MTKEKELTPEEHRALNVKNTLESKLMQNIVGGNQVKKNPFVYGQLGLQGGEQTYLDAKSDEDFHNQRKAMYDQSLKQKEQLGIAEEPSYPTDYQVVAQMMTGLQEVQAMAKLSELEKYAKAVGADLDFEVPEELKDISEADIIIEAKEKGALTEKGLNLSKLDKKYNDAYHIKELLTKSYERACALNAGQTNYFTDLNQMGKQIVDEYKKSN